MIADPIPAASPVRRIQGSILEGHDLHKQFGETPALRGIDFSLLRGEIVAVMGPSGSGKSTLLHCLAGISLPDRGSVSFEGQAIEGLSDAQRSRLRRSSFGFVFQFGQLVPELSALVNVALPLLLIGVRRSDAIQLAAEFDHVQRCAVRGKNLDMGVHAEFGADIGGGFEGGPIGIAAHHDGNFWQGVSAHG